MNNVMIALGLTLLAGMATGLGSVIAFTVKRTNYRFLSVATGFSAGVMLYVSFVEIFYKGLDALTIRYGETLGNWINTASFFGGIVLIGIIDALIPSETNPHEPHSEEEINSLLRGTVPDTMENRIESATPDPAGRAAAKSVEEQKLLRMGLFTALAIAIHNFPEGLATFLAALNDPGLGVAIAVAIALHNIPEGISVAIPIFYATGSRSKAFLHSFLSGLAEPVGAGAAYLALRFFLGGTSGVFPPQVMGILFGGVAGIMVYISLDELLPASRAYGKGHDSLLGLLAGMVVMAVSLLLLK
ncbi:MAG: zinc transporter ZupT [Anaerolineales bacterium]|nr:zinc transporter ZupT [Anaerolineales bacterium]